MREALRARYPHSLRYLCEPATWPLPNLLFPTLQVTRESSLEWNLIENRKKITISFGHPKACPNISQCPTFQSHLHLISCSKEKANSFPYPPPLLGTLVHSLGGVREIYSKNGLRVTLRLLIYPLPPWPRAPSQERERTKTRKGIERGEKLP